MRIQLHESWAPLLRGVGLTVVLLGTVLAAVQSRQHAAIRSRVAAADFGAHTYQSSAATNIQEKALSQLTLEVDELRETVDDGKTVEEVLANPWFDTLGIIGSSITAASFYVEWMCKRPRRRQQPD